MEACASAHEWGRAITDLGHDVRLIPPSYVKPYVKRQKNDTADAEAIVEAGSRPTMRFVAVKTEEQQARSMVFRTRDLLVRQRTQLINALRGHLAEHGIVAPQGPAHLKTLAEAIGDAGRSLPQLVRDVGGVYLQQIEQLNEKIVDLDKVLRREARCATETRRLQTMPGIGPITAMAVEVFAPPMATFKRVAILQPGSVWFQSSIRRAESSASVERRKWGSEIFAGFSSLAPCPSSSGRHAVGLKRAPGSTGCWRGSR